ncbi:MAG: YHS domain-containing (seleno)protein [Pseudomonadota bacterium]
MRPITHTSPFGIFRSLVAVTLLVSTSLAFAALPVNTLKRGLINETPTEVAINGYDTVAYFTEKKPVKGSDVHSFKWQGGTWKFASQSNLELFKASPEKYAPQYGGYCAYGVSQGYLVSVEPEQFSIIDDKLYLNYNAGVQKKWTKDAGSFNKTADAKFGDLLKK